MFNVVFLKEKWYHITDIWYISSHLRDKIQGSFQFKDHLPLLTERERERERERDFVCDQRLTKLLSMAVLINGVVLWNTWAQIDISFQRNFLSQFKGQSIIAFGNWEYNKVIRYWNS